MAADLQRSKPKVRALPSPSADGDQGSGGTADVKSVGGAIGRKGSIGVRSGSGNGEKSIGGDGSANNGATAASASAAEEGAKSQGGAQEGGQGSMSGDAQGGSGEGTKSEEGVSDKKQGGSKEEDADSAKSEALKQVGCVYLVRGTKHFPKHSPCVTH